jgi:UPF0716 protein FxsA
VPLGLIILTGFLLEIFVLVAVGSKIGALTTVAWVILSAVIGMAMMRAGARRAMMGERSRPQAGEAPQVAQIRNFADSTVFMFGGILLILPGFITDAIGLLVLIPQVRRKIVASLTHSAHWQSYATQRGYSEYDVQHVIEGEYHRMDD